MVRKAQFTFERELDGAKAAEEAVKQVFEAFAPPEKQTYFIPFLQELLEDEETSAYAPKLLTTLFWNEQNKEGYADFLQQLIERSARGHWQRDLGEYAHKKSGRHFSTYAYTWGENFIQMMKLSSEHYDTISELYSHLIRYEMKMETQRQEEKLKPQQKKKAQTTKTPNQKKLYDDIFDYLTERARFHSETLNQENPNEFILLLTDRLRSTKRYCMQDAITRRALERKKQLEKEMKEREASAEEIIKTYPPFKNALRLFREAKDYNFRYMKMEKKRVAMQLFPLILGVSGIGAGLMELYELDVFGMVSLALVALLPSLLLTRQIMARFYPLDQTDVLEQEIGLLVPILKKCSQNQMASLLNRLIKEVDDPALLQHMPDFLTYVFSVIPERNQALMNREQLEETLSRLRYSVTHRLRQVVLKTA